MKSTQKMMQERFPWQLSLATSYLGFFYQVCRDIEILYQVIADIGQYPNQTDEIGQNNAENMSFQSLKSICNGLMYTPVW